MSTILKALRRLEEDDVRKQTAPLSADVNLRNRILAEEAAAAAAGGHDGGPAQPGTSSWPRLARSGRRLMSPALPIVLLLLLLLLLVGLVATAGWYWLRDEPELVDVAAAAAPAASPLPASPAPSASLPPPLPTPMATPMATPERAPSVTNGRPTHATPEPPPVAPADRGPARSDRARPPATLIRSLPSPSPEPAPQPRSASASEPESLPPSAEVSSRQRPEARPPAPRMIPDVGVLRTSWHPRVERRSARIRVIASGEELTLREGDAIGGLIVKEISPSAVVFTTGEVEVRRRVGHGIPSTTTRY